MPALLQRCGVGWEVRVVMVVEADALSRDALKTMVILGLKLKYDACAYSVLDFQSNVQSCNPLLGNITTCSTDVEN